MWIDTHCHLDADEFDADRDAVVARARAAGVTMQVLPAAHVSHFAKTAAVARQYGLAYALGIHPLWVGQSDEADIERLHAAVRAALADPRFVAIGEIGLDFYIEGLDRVRQEWFYREQLKVARDFGLPAILHVRRSADALLRELGRIEVPGGIAHAFNGSEDQAGRFVARGFKLGFGGAMTYDGSLRIRRLAATLPDTGWVLETDSPDIPPQWFRDGRAVLRNEPAELPRMAEVMAQLRGVELDRLARQNEANAREALPRLAGWLDEVAAVFPHPAAPQPPSPGGRGSKAPLPRERGWGEGRPLARGTAQMPAVLAAFVLGIFALQLQAALPTAAIVVTLAAVALVAAATAGHLRNPTAAAALLALAAALAGFTYAAWRADLRLADQLAPADEGRDLRIVGLIDSLPAQLQRGTRFEFEVERVLAPPDVHVPDRIALAWYGPQASVRPGQRWEFSVRLRRPHGGVNPGGFDLEAWLLERNLRATGYVRSGRMDEAPRLLEAMVWTPSTTVDRARDALRERLQALLAGQRYGGVLIALVLGDQRAISEADWLLFNRTGIAHLVSISGLHITMIAGLAAWLVAGLWRRSRRALAFAPVQSAAAVAAMLAALAYCLLAGWGVPAQRTFFMLATVAVALLSRRSPGMFTTLALAAAVVCALDPWAVVAPGFWLSFGAVAAIFWIGSGRLAADAPGWKPRLLLAARVQGAVTLMLVPLTLVLFRQVSLVSPLANAVAIPLVSLVVTPLALLGALFAVLPGPLATVAVPFLAIAGAVFDVLAEGLVWLAQWNWAAIALPAPPWWTLPLALAGVLWLLAPRGWPLRWAGALWLLPLLAWPPQRPAAGELWVTALDVGQGMALLVETHHAVLLYDPGPRYSPDADAGSRVVLPYLRWRGIGALDVLVVSHLDSDHSGGAGSVLASVLVRRVVSSIPAGHPALAGAAAERCQTGEGFALGEAQVRVLHPTAADYARKLPTNAVSCVLQVTLGSQRVLLTGDIPARQEAELMQREPDLRARLAVAPHHGSRHSSSAEWVAAVAPEWVAVQAGYRNRFGHPDPGVVARWTAQGAKLVRTDHNGAVQWRLHADGAGEVESWRLDHRRYWHNQPGEAGIEEVDADDDAPAATREPAAEAVRSTGAE